ncbi:MAG: response regulator transcription factor [Dehalococcoidia bacterium]
MAKLLVVEDDRAILETIAFNLERDGHEIVTASNGASGLRLAREQDPALIILDLMLPGMHGLDVCRLVREEQATPIIILTARDTEQERIDGLDLGADDYLTKPFSMRELRARVSALLRRDQLSRGAAAQVVEGERLEADDLVLDVGKHELTKRGAVVALRPREFTLLEYLMRHAGQVMSRDRILEAVWGYTYAGETRTVDVHVRWLREKIEDQPSAPRHIVTVRSFGYRFDP